MVGTLRCGVWSAQRADPTFSAWHLPETFSLSFRAKSRNLWLFL